MGYIRFITWLAVLSALLTGAARLTVLRWWRVPLDDPYLSASIAPTLFPGDWVILWRATPPVFGDLVVCPNPDDPAKVVIGRLVGESRDQVRFSGATIYINGSRIATESRCAEDDFEVQDPRRDYPVRQKCSMEAMGASTHKRGELSGEQKSGMESTHVIPDGEVFLVSDNRLFPWDSRDYSTLPAASCSQTVVFRLVSAKGYFDVENRMSFIQ